MDQIQNFVLMGYILCMNIDSHVGSSIHEQTKTLIKECALMHKFDHPNIISLVGICLDAGPSRSPYIIFPFMENGNLHSYVEDNKAILLTDTNTDEETVG